MIRNAVTPVGLGGITSTPVTEAAVFPGQDSLTEANRLQAVLHSEFFLLDWLPTKPIGTNLPCYLAIGRKIWIPIIQNDINHESEYNDLEWNSISQSEALSNTPQYLLHGGK